MDERDEAFHASTKPHFSESGVFSYGSKGTSTLGGLFVTVQEPLIGATKDIRFTRMPSFPDVSEDG